MEFGDLTVLVGQQASGKTLFLEFLKLFLDAGYIHDQLAKHGYEWGNEAVRFLDLYLGEGMSGTLTDGSRFAVDGQPVDIASYVRRRKASKNRVFYIPAQRVLTLTNGWPLPFQGFGIQDPYVVREFSEQFRLLMTSEHSKSRALFPQTNRLKKAYRTMLSDHIFHGYGLKIDTHGAQRRLVLSHEESSQEIPFMAWSAGQREFVPLLMGLYWLLPAAKVAMRESIEWAVIEEVEAGLHPAAISAVLLLVLELVARGYRVCLSTHSPHVLDVIWAIRTFQEYRAGADRVLELFRAPKSTQTRSVADTILAKELKVYYFDSATGDTKDISKLDPASEDPIEAGWGGLTEFVTPLSR